MYRTVIAAFALLAACQSPPTPTPPTELAISIRPVPATASEPKHLLVTMRFPLKPGQAAYIREGVARPPDPECIPADFRLTDITNAAPDPANPEIYRPSGAGDVSVTFKAIPGVRDFAFPILGVTGCQTMLWAEDTIIFDGRALFYPIRVVEADRKPVAFPSTSVVFSGLPAGWTIRSSLGAAKPDAPTTSPDFDDIRSAYYALGKISVATSRAGGIELATIAAPNAAVRAADARDIATRTLARFTKQWGPAIVDRYAIFLVDTAGGPKEIGDFTGLARMDAHVLFAQTATRTETLRVGVVHEILHAWTPGRINSSLAELDWLREGVTDYMSDRTLLDFGLIPASQLVDHVNVAMRNLKLREIRQRDVYDEGYVMSFAMDTPNLTGASGVNSVADFVGALVKAVDTITTEQGALEAASRLGLIPAGEPARRDSIRLRCSIALDGSTFTLMSTHWPDYDSGFTLSTATSGLIDTVAAGSNAARAGLKPGAMILQELSGASGAILMPATLRVRDPDGAERTYSYLPQGKPGATEYPQYVRADAIPAGATRATNCRN